MMLRRAYQFLTFVSALACACMAFCFVRSHFASDHFHCYRWNSSAYAFTDSWLALQEGGIFIHSETTGASATDNPSTVRTLAGISDSQIVHHAWPPGLGSSCPILWGDHYRSSPSPSLGLSGMSNCCTVEFRCDFALVFFSLLPASWIVKTLRARALRSQVRGFAVLDSSLTTPAKAESR
jgi:hypothetical protein